MDDKTDPRGKNQQLASGFDRRSFMAGAAGSAVLPLTARAAAPVTGAPLAVQDPSLPVPVNLRVNGEDKSLTIDARSTVLIGGRRVLSCLTLALVAQDQDITTIEGLGDGGKLHPMQQAFIDQDAFQCGYCTPGQIMSAVACVKEGHADSEESIREYMSGNICRCAAYPNIVAAVKQAAPAISSSSSEKG